MTTTCAHLRLQRSTPSKADTHTRTQFSVSNRALITRCNSRVRFCAQRDPSSWGTETINHSTHIRRFSGTSPRSNSSPWIHQTPVSLQPPQPQKHLQQRHYHRQNMRPQLWVLHTVYDSGTTALYLHLGRRKPLSRHCVSSRQDMDDPSKLIAACRERPAVVNTS